MPLISNMTEKRLDVGGNSIGYSEGPDNGPVLVLIHGVTGRRDSFLNVIPTLREKFHLFSIDQRGHGLSDHMTGHYHITEYANDLISFVESVSDGPAYVWGQSLGAAVTIDAAGRAPDSFAAVVLEDPPLGVNKSRTSLHATFKIWHELAASDLSVDEIEKRLQNVDMRAAGAAARYKAETLFQLDQDVLTAALEETSWNNYDVQTAFKKVLIPAFLMQADPDCGGIISDELLDSLRPLASNMQHRRFNGSGHKVHGDQPEKALESVLEFLGKN